VNPLQSLEHFRGLFNAGLARLLDENTLSSFILVAANASFDPVVYDELSLALGSRFASLSAGLSAALSDGHSPPVVEEDLLVFLKICLLGFDGLGQTEFRRQGPWQLQFNRVRAFRPARISRAVPDSIRLPFNPDGFNFNKPFMLQERFWSGELLGRPVDFYYNKYPFALLHTLIVPEREQHLPQYLQARDIRFCWDLLQGPAAALPGCGIGYNSVGAYASVNHLHLQLFTMAAPLPVMDERWRHHGGGQAYPVECRFVSDPNTLIDEVARLHQTDQPYNLLFVPDGAYLFVRARQGTVEIPAWMTGVSWMELAGGLLTFSRERYLTMRETEIEAALGRVSL